MNAIGAERALAFRPSLWLARATGHGDASGAPGLCPHHAAERHLHKLGLMAERHGAALERMAAIKRAPGPLNIMNPGKTTPAM